MASGLKYPDETEKEEAVALSIFYSSYAFNAAAPSFLYVEFMKLPSWHEEVLLFRWNVFGRNGLSRKGSSLFVGGNHVN